MTASLPTRALLLTLSCLLVAGCRRRSTRVEAPPPEPAPAASPMAGKDVAQPSVYDAGNAQAREAASKDRRFMKLALAFRDGGSAQRKTAREELQKLPPAERTEFETLCRNMGIKTD